MFNYIKDEELRELLVGIQEKKEVNNIYTYLQLLDKLEEKEVNLFVEDVCNNFIILNYLCENIKHIDLDKYNNVLNIIKKLLLETKNTNIKINLYEIYAKSKFEMGVYIALDETDEEVKEYFFEKLFLIIKNDKSLQCLNKFVELLKRNTCRFEDGIIFDFIEILSYVDLNSETYNNIKGLAERIEGKDIRQELLKIVYKNFKLSNEYDLIENIINGKISYIGDFKLDLNLFAISLDSKSIRDIIKILQCLKKKKIYIELVNLLISDNYIGIDTKKMIKIIYCKELYCTKEQRLFLEQYISLNNISINEFKREYCQKEYINDIVKQINKYINNKNIDSVKYILKNEKKEDILAEISKNIVDISIDNNLDELLKVWDDLELPLSLKLEYANKIREQILLNENVSHDQIQFLIDMNLDDLEFYKNLSNESVKRDLLYMWNKNNKNGKIVDVIKYRIDREVEKIEDLQDIKEIIDLYNINDIKLEAYIKLKVYSYIELKLLDIDYNNKNDVNKLDFIVDIVVEYNLENRLLTDKYILDLLDKEIKDILVKKIIAKSQSENVLEAFWDIIDDAIRSNKKRDVIYNLKIILPHIIESSKKIDWFLDLLSEKKYNYNIIENIIEICLDTMKENKKVINYLNEELEEAKPQVMMDIAKNIAKNLTMLEKSIININDENQKNILINNMKGLRTSLNDLGIETVEDISNYNEIAELDEDKHLFIGNDIDSIGIISSLGVKVNDEIISKSIISDIEGEK